MRMDLDDFDVPRGKLSPVVVVAAAELFESKMCNIFYAFKHI